jgi:hypothetical protein
MTPFHSKGDLSMKIRTVGLESTGWIVVKEHKENEGWVSVWERPDDNEVPDILVWSGPIWLWIELRYVFNELHALIAGDKRPGPGKAFPAHENAIDTRPDGWPL